MNASPTIAHLPRPFVVAGVARCDRCASADCAVLTGGPCTGLPWPATVEMLSEAAADVADRDDANDDDLDGSDEPVDDESETCRAEACEESLSDNEGYDGYCGTHADLVCAHEEGEHDDDPVTDCPDCD